MMLSLLALAASVRPDSLNKRLLALAATEAETLGAKVTILDYRACDAPLYRDEEGATIPLGAATLSRALQAHDGLLLASPEYNWSMPGELKNLIDWLSIDPAQPLKGKPALLMCASPSVRGGISGLQQLTIPLEHLGMWVYPQLIGIGDAKTQIGEQRLTRASDHGHLTTSLHDFIRAATAFKAANA